MSSTSLVQSTSTNNLSRSQSHSQSPATKVKNVISNPVAALTPQKGLFSPSGARNASPAVSTPGRWQHPRMEEIVRRQNASCFNPGDSKIVVLNAAAIVFTFIAQPYISSYVALALLSNVSQLTILQHPHINHPQCALRRLRHPHSPASSPDQHSHNPFSSLPPPGRLRGHPSNAATKARPGSASYEPPSNTTRGSTICNTATLFPQRYTSFVIRLSW